MGSIELPIQLIYKVKLMGVHPREEKINITWDDVEILNYTNGNNTVEGVVLAANWLLRAGSTRTADTGSDLRTTMSSSKSNKIGTYGGAVNTNESIDTGDDNAQNVKEFRCNRVTGIRSGVAALSTTSVALADSGRLRALSGDRHRSGVVPGGRKSSNGDKSNERRELHVELV